MEPVYVCEIQTYEISVGRSQLYRESESEFARHWERHIKLNLNPGRFGDGVTIANILLYDDFESGSFVRRNDSTVNIYITIEDYDNIYKLLRTERPLYFWWQIGHSSEDSSYTDSWRITTMSEPIGEGDSEI